MTIEVIVGICVVLLIWASCFLVCGGTRSGGWIEPWAWASGRRKRPARSGACFRRHLEVRGRRRTRALQQVAEDARSCRSRRAPKDAPLPRDTARAMSQENVEIVRRAYARFDARGPNREYLDPEIEWRGPREFPDLAEPHFGHQGVERYMDKLNGSLRRLPHGFGGVLRCGRGSGARLLAGGRARQGQRGGG